MPEKPESYWAKHHWNIIQCVLGVAALVVAIFQYFTSKQPPSAGTVTPLRASYSMPWYLLACIIGLVLSVLIPAIVNVITKEKKENLRKSAEETHKSALDQIEKETNEAVDAAECAGAQARLLWHFGNQAKHLEVLLPRIWHDWDNAGQKLMYPFGNNEWKEFTVDKCMPLLRDLDSFSVQYRSHIDWIKIELPGLKSEFIQNSCSPRERYSDVLAGLKYHAQSLGSLAKQIWDSESPMESLDDEAS
jgi:hypothetical protein